MCKELELIQTHLGIWPLENWTVRQCATQLAGLFGVYCIKNTYNGKLLIGEGRYRRRLTKHISGSGRNNKFKIDVNQYGEDCFQVQWIILENNESYRKLLENKLQFYFNNNCYNTLRRQYPSQTELLEHTDSKHNSGLYLGNITERLNNYTKVQRMNEFDECWESHYSSTAEYGLIRYNNIRYSHHVLMYILHYGDICSISSVIHHKCENKKCVNPEHLELTTNIGNSHKHHRYVQPPQRKLSSKYLGVRKKDSKYLSSIFISTEINLGSYQDEKHAAQNRDYYIVRNNFWDKREARLNFHNIDYHNFQPWPMSKGKMNRHFTENH